MSLDTLLGAAVVRPVFLGRFDIKDALIEGWTGPGLFVPTETGDPLLDGRTFVEAEGAVEVGEIQENEGTGGQIQIVFGAGELDDEAMFLEIVKDRRKFIGRRATLWLAFLSDDESSVLPEIEREYDGIMAGAETTRQIGDAATITLKCDQDLSGASGPSLRWIEHQMFYPTDTASTFINDVGRGGIASARQPGAGPPPMTDFNSRPHDYNVYEDPAYYYYILNSS